MNLFGLKYRKCPHIFLDIDGVLNHGTSAWLDHNNVRALRTIAEECNPIVILTSSWRLTPNSGKMQYLFSLLDSNDIVVYDRVTNLGNRRKEIQRYIKAHFIKNYAILDDEDYYSGSNLEEHWFKTDFDEGLTKEIAERVTACLTKEPVK